MTGMVFDRPFRAGVRPVRAALGLPEVRSADQLLRRAPRLLVATGKPFEYPDTRWGDSVELIGPAIFDPPAQPPAWLDDIDRPIVLVTTSSVGQADRALVSAAVRAFAGDDVHVVASLPADEDGELCHRPGVTLARFVPHSLVLDRAVCVVTHGGMGITQKALDRGIPVCAVPFGRDQFEVARRIEVARCGVRLPARRLSAPRLRAAVNSALTRSAGAAEVAAGFAATGGCAALRTSWRTRSPVSQAQGSACGPTVSGSLGARASIVAAGLHPVAADRHRTPAGGVGLAAVDQEQPAFGVGARS